MKNFLRKRWSDILLGLFLVLMIIPQTRQPVQVFIQRLIAFSPSTIEKPNRENLQDYNLIIQNEKGQNFNLADHKGEVIILNFWATWCPPCIAEMPDFQKLYTDYGDKVQFYFVTQDKWELINKFEDKRKYQLPYFQLIQPNNRLNYTQLPTTYVLDKEGGIVLEKTGVADWDSKSFRITLDELIAQ